MRVSASFIVFDRFYVFTLGLKPCVRVCASVCVCAYRGVRVPNPGTESSSERCVVTFCRPNLVTRRSRRDFFFLFTLHRHRPSLTRPRYRTTAAARASHTNAVVVVVTVVVWPCPMPARTPARTNVADDASDDYARCIMFNIRSAECERRGHNVADSYTYYVRWR